MKIGAVVLVAALILVAAALLLASAAWNRQTRADADRLRAGATKPAAAERPISTPTPRTTTGADASLPAPVARFLARSLPADGREIRLATVTQEGTFLMREPDGWAPFTATQLFRTDPPAFLWEARIRMAPLLRIHVRDSYLDGVGSMRGAVAGLVTVAQASGTPEMASGSLYRFLAEAAWLPTRLRPSESLQWEPIDDTTALATLSDGDIRVAVRFRFNADGDIVGIHVPERAREVDGGYEPTAWSGVFFDHAEIDGFRIPTRGEVAWVIEGEARPYWKGRILDVAYEYR